MVPDNLLVRCCAHILNLLVQDAINVANSVIEIIRDLVRHCLLYTSDAADD